MGIRIRIAMTDVPTKLIGICRTQTMPSHG